MKAFILRTTLSDKSIFPFSCCLLVVYCLHWQNKRLQKWLLNVPLSLVTWILGQRNLARVQRKLRGQSRDLVWMYNLLYSIFLHLILTQRLNEFKHRSHFWYCEICGRALNLSSIRMKLESKPSCHLNVVDNAEVASSISHDLEKIGAILKTKIFTNYIRDYLDVGIICNETLWNIYQLKAFLVHFGPDLLADGGCALYRWTAGGATGLVAVVRLQRPPSGNANGVPDSWGKALEREK